MGQAALPTSPRVRSSSWWRTRRSTSASDASTRSWGSTPPSRYSRSRATWRCRTRAGGPGTLQAGVAFNPSNASCRLHNGHFPSAKPYAALRPSSMVASVTASTVRCNCRPRHPTQNRAGWLSQKCGQLFRVPHRRALAPVAPHEATFTCSVSGCVRVSSLSGNITRRGRGAGKVHAIGKNLLTSVQRGRPHRFPTHFAAKCASDDVEFSARRPR